MKTQPTQPTQPTMPTKPNLSFQKKAIIEGEGLKNLVKTFGEETADVFVKKVSTAITGLQNIKPDAVLRFDQSIISGNKVALKGKYADSHSVENLAITVSLNKKATPHKTHRQLARFFENFKPTDLFNS